MIDLLRARRRLLPDGGVCRFGGSESSSSQTTNNTDARVVGGDDSQNASVTGNTGPVSITSTDHGAVNASLAVALKGVEEASKLARETTAANGGLLDGALRMSQAQNDKFASALENLKGSDNRTLQLVGFTVVGLAAVMLFRKG